MIEIIWWTQIIHRSFSVVSDATFVTFYMPRKLVEDEETCKFSFKLHPWVRLEWTVLTFTRFSIIENDSWIQLKNLAESKVLGSINYTKVNVKYIQIRSALYQIEELFSNWIITLYIWYARIILVNVWNSENLAKIELGL